MSGIRLIVLVFLIACCYALTACGGGSADDDSTSPAPADKTDRQHIPPHTNPENSL